MYINQPSGRTLCVFPIPTWTNTDFWRTHRSPLYHKPRSIKVDTDISSPYYSDHDGILTTLSPLMKIPDWRITRMAQNTQERGLPILRQPGSIQSHKFFLSISLTFAPKLTRNCGSSLNSDVQVNGLPQNHYKLPTDSAYHIAILMETMRAVFPR